MSEVSLLTDSSACLSTIVSHDQALAHTLIVLLSEEEVSETEEGKTTGPPDKLCKPR